MIPINLRESPEDPPQTASAVRRSESPYRHYRGTVGLLGAYFALTVSLSMVPRHWQPKVLHKKAKGRIRAEIIVFSRACCKGFLTIFDGSYITCRLSRGKFELSRRHTTCQLREGRQSSTITRSWLSDPDLARNSAPARRLFGAKKGWIMSPGGLQQGICRQDTHPIPGTRIESTYCTGPDARGPRCRHRTILTSLVLAQTLSRRDPAIGV